MQRIFIAWMMAVFVVPAPVLACLWDNDTIQMERQRFPYAQELISGHFLRHSDFYYEWRVADRSSKAPYERTPADYDDLAVAFDKLGQQDKAIATIQEKLARWPDENRYESEANLGTFLIHAGRLEEGLVHIERAIEINPEAHFGREVYQKLLVKYVIRQRSQGATLPLIKVDNPDSDGFGRFVLREQHIPEQERTQEIQKAVKGVLGMMRFGHYDSPILLEALGDLMLAEPGQEDSKLLAARAYLKASYAAEEETAADAYRQLAKQIIDLQAGRNLSQLEGELQQEMRQADAYFAQIEVDEKSWAAAGGNLDALYSQKYYTEPTLDVNLSNYSAPPESGVKSFRVYLVLGLVIAGLVFIRLVRRVVS